LAVAYTLPFYVAQFIQERFPALVETWPKDAAALCVRGVLTLVFIVYFFMFRKGRVVGLSTRRLGGDIVWGLVACGVMAALYLAAIGLLFLGIVWFTGSAKLFSESIQRMPMGDLTLGHVIAVSLIYPVLEELWFRALMYPSMRLHFGPVLAILLLSVIFGMAHPWPPITQTIGGLAFAYAYEKRQTIYASIILHIAGNGILFVIGWAMREGIIKL
jgi:membrane protease YdiL (CAAX protease family)